MRSSILNPLVLTILLSSSALDASASTSRVFGRATTGLVNGKPCKSSVSFIKIRIWEKACLKMRIESNPTGWTFCFPLVLPLQTQCLSNSCQSKVCADLIPLGGTCYKSNMCQSKNCADGLCSKAGLLSLNSPCKSSTVCSSGLCSSSKCSKIQGIGGSCTKNSGCKSGPCYLSKVSRRIRRRRELRDARVTTN